MPLYPTLGGQLYAISREFGLPSIGGLNIYLCDDGEGNPGPRVSEETWSFLWARYFDENADDLYQEITNPPSVLYSRDQSYSATSAENEDFNETNETNHSSRKPHPPFAYDARSTSPRQFATPSPFRSRSDARASPAPSSTARLPIVSRIEWAVDRVRAPWWNQWLGEAGRRAHVNGVSQRTQPKKKSGRRSMHLPQLRSVSLPQNAKAQGVSPLTRSTVLVPESSSDASDGASDGKSDEQQASTSYRGSIQDDPTQGYQPLEEEDELPPMTVPSTRNVRPPSHSGDVYQREAPGRSYDAQSYAGYSAVMGVVNAPNSLDERSMTENEGPARDAESNSGVRSPHRRVFRDSSRGTFDLGALNESDEAMWQDLQAHDGVRHGSHSVREWIFKTQSPPVTKNTSEAHEGSIEEETLLPPEDDVGDVVGLWAETRSLQGARQLAGHPAPPSVRTSYDSRLSNRQSLQSNRSHGPPSTTSRRTIPGFTATDPLNVESQLPATLPESSPSQGPTLNKASLLSPIALQEESSGTFSGPPANLSSFLASRGVESSQPRQQATLSTQTSAQSTSAKPEPNLLTTMDVTPEHRNTLRSPRLELPPTSPGARSASSGSSDLSDALVDMERALALLSPAASQQSPALQGGTPKDRPKKPRVSPNMSASESLARARSLSASVVPSPHWFRTRAAMPDLPRAVVDLDHTSPDVRRSVVLSEPEEQAESVQVSPRPKSTSATMHKTQRDMGSLDLTSVAAASSNMLHNVKDNKEGDQRRESQPIDDFIPEQHRQDGGYSLVDSASQTLASPRQHSVDRESDLDTAVSNAQWQNPVRELGPEAPSIGFQPQSQDHPVHTSPPDHLMPTKYTNNLINGTESSSNFLVDQPPDSVNTTLGHAEGDNASIPLSQIGVEDTGSMQNATGDRHVMPTLERSNVTEDATIIDHDKDSVREAKTSHPLSSTHTESYSQDENWNEAIEPSAPRYATVGVQAQGHSSPRDSSQFSLITGDASSISERSFSDDEASNAQDTNVRSPAPLEDEWSETPLARQDSAGFGLQVPEHTTEDDSTDHGVFARMLRGDSFPGSTSDPYASTVVSPGQNMASREDLIAPVVEASEGHLDDVPSHEAPQSTHSPIMTATETKAHVVPSESLTGFSSSDRWSQDGSAVYDADVMSGEEYNDLLSPATMARQSRVSTFSYGASASDAGGRTPTFYYDNHLSDDDPSSIPSKRNSHRMSVGSTSRRTSKLSPSQFPSQSSNLLAVSVSEPNADLASRSPDALGLGIENSLSHTEVPCISADTTVSRNDIISMAGEELDQDGNHMPDGFEEVEVHSAKRSSSMTSSSAQREVKSNSESPEARSSISDTPKMEIPVKRGNKGLRRSLGSLSDKMRNNFGNRRASASATSLHTDPAPRRSKFVAQDGTLTSNRRSTSPLSPRPRFGPLPPSPSVQMVLPNVRNNTGFTSSGPLSPMTLSETSPSFPHSTSTPSSTYTDSVSDNTAAKLATHVSSPRKSLSALSTESRGFAPSASHFAVATSPPILNPSAPVFRGRDATPTPPSPRGPRSQPWSTPAPPPTDEGRALST